MIFFDPPHIVAKAQRTPYLLSRAALALISISIALCIVHGIIFRPEVRSYRFADPRPGSLEKPVSESGGSIRSGVVPGGTGVITFAGVPGSFREAEILIRLSDDSQRPPDFPVTIRRSHRSFFLPTGDPIEVAPKERGFVVGERLYLWTPDGRLHPLISERAALSRFPKDRILRGDDELLEIFPPGATEAGFRIGALVSHGDTVYQVLPDNRLRPFHGREAFTALGYDWDDILPIDEREFSAYRVDSLFRPASAQPDGTVFQDTDTDSLFIVESDRLRRIDDRAYADFLTSLIRPIAVSTDAASASLGCVATRGIFGGSTYRCTIPLDALASAPGSSYRISFRSEPDIIVESLEAKFTPDYSRETLEAFIRDLGERISDRYRRLDEQTL